MCVRWMRAAAAAAAAAARMAVSRSNESTKTKASHSPPKARTDKVGEPQRAHGLVGAEPHALVDVLGGADALFGLVV